MITLEQLDVVLRDEFPGFRIIRKEDSTFMKVLDVLLRIITFNQMKVFMTRFVTTTGVKVYVPSNWENMSETAKVIILYHERVHMRQKRKYGVLFSFLYLFFPFPVVFAYFRAKFEKEAYEETIVRWYEARGDMIWNEENRESMIRHFTSAEYFWMWPFRGSIERWYDNLVKQLRDGR